MKGRLSKKFTKEGQETLYARKQMLRKENERVKVTREKKKVETFSNYISLPFLSGM